MPHKTWDELYKLDVSTYTKQRDGTPYIPWAKMVWLLRKEGGYTKVFFRPIGNPVDGSSVWHSDKTFGPEKKTNSAYEVHIEVTLGDEQGEETFVYPYPISSGITPMRDESMTQNRVFAAVARGFTKAAAIKTGLSFSLWADVEDDDDPVDDLSSHDVFKVRQRIQEAYTVLLKKKMSTADIAKALEMTEDEVKAVFTYADALDRLEKKLNALKQ